ncbi:MAG: F0F1 ATP synthase subunit B [Gemmatimonadetes bacterium]|nr:F0F1 ATP synthase subunit B [Gemmatimonadota bacterium]
MRRSLFAATALAFAATPLHAAEEGGGLLSVNPGLTIWTIIIFLIVLAVLSKFAYPRILGAVEAREAHIAQLTLAAERDREEAAALAAENRRLVEETRARVHGAVEEARGQAEKMRAEVMDAANRERQEMLERARRDIVSEREMALDTVRRDAVVLAMAAAEKLVRRSLDTEDNRRLVRESLAQMGAPAARA